MEGKCIQLASEQFDRLIVIAYWPSDSLSGFGRELFYALEYSSGNFAEFVVRGLVVFGTPTLMTSSSLSLGCRSVYIQWVLFVVGALIGLLMPLHDLGLNIQGRRVWVILVGGSILVFLPSLLPRYLFATRVMQLKATIAGYLFLTLMFVSNG